MNRIVLWNVLLSSTLIFNAQVSSDCGCNANRNEGLNASPLVNEIEDASQKVCQKRPREHYKHYRDYYPESAPPLPNNMAHIPGGEYILGTNDAFFPEDAEAPERLVKIKDFFIDKHEISNIEFEEFIKLTNYTTEAEVFGDSFLFKSFLSKQQQKQLEDFRVAAAPWWFKVKGVSWKHPHGVGSDLKGLEKHPVVHVSWNDAKAYCEWAKKRLPTEIEFEVACRGGKKRKLYPWGNKLMPHDKHWLNIWQGEFPDVDTAEDGFHGTCPVDKFRQNDYDLYNIVGNVWEWTSDLWDPKDTDNENPNRVKKGGSYLCHKNYCYRYRCAARQANTQDSSAGNLGFRCAKDA